VSPIYFFTFNLFSIILFIGINSTYPFNLLPIIFVFIGIPLFDLIIGEDKSNPRPDQEMSWQSSAFWGPAVYFYVITHFAILSYSLSKSTNLAWDDLVIGAIAVGLYTGGLGITVAHELCHKKEKLPRFVADLILASVCYKHFSIEHVRGHHLQVATKEDPASSRRDESVYPFLLRTITGTFLHALQLDKTGVIKGVAFSLIFVSSAFFFDLRAGAFFVIQSIVAIVLLELVNYVEHYGLSRKKLSHGRYEKVLPIHSWNSSHKFSNLILFNLQRHSDHHATAHLPYTVLKHQELAPQLPTGYPGMIMLALVPPIWFKVMNPKVVEAQKFQN
jgi:alkane 1-monooxygenase